MPNRVSGELSFRPAMESPFGDGIELWEAVREADDPADRIYSCIAVCRKEWRRDWPALGGTRWKPLPLTDVAALETAIRREAHELAMSMFVKNNMLRKAEQQLPSRGASLFGWQGGKGVFWSPLDGSGKRHLTPARLMAHGQLVERLRGDYIASKDAGVGTRELRWIERATQYTVGTGCLRDTGEATAEGAAEGMRATWKRLERSDEASLRGVSVMICGLGKVGIPLLRILDSRDGAEVHVYEPKLFESGAEPPASLAPHLRAQMDAGAAVKMKPGEPGETPHCVEWDLLSRYPASRFVRSEAEALASGAAILCCAVGEVNWLGATIDDGSGRQVARYRILASLPAEKRPRLILGPANDQVTMARTSSERDEILRTLDAAGILFVPDPAVSPGGVIAVSHELGVWNGEVVNRDAREIVNASIGMLFDRAGAGATSASLYAAFSELARGEA